MQFFAFLLFLLTLAPTASMAQTAISEKVANAYYQACMEHDDDRLGGESQDALCGCMSVKIMSALTLEDIAAMSPKPGPGRAAFDKMLMNVYGPCMKAPVEDTLYRQCMGDRKIKEFSLRDTGKLCRCTASRSGAYYEQQAEPMMQDILRRAPGLSDPVTYILDDQGLRQRAEDILFECLKE
jgi:hypothetical protein